MQPQLFKDLIMMILGDEDYLSETFNISFIKGTTSASFDIVIIDDNILERNDEVFTLAIIPESLPNGVYHVDNQTVPVSIVDDECKLLTCTI